MSVKISLAKIKSWTIICYVVFSMLEQIQFVNVLPIGGFLLLTRIAILFLCFLDLMQLRQVNKWALIFAPILLVLFIVSATYSEKRYIIELFLVLWLCRNLEVDRVVKGAVICEFAVLFITIIASQIGLVENVVKVRYESSVVREGLGFNYTTYSANYFFHLVLCITVLLKNKIKLWHVIVLELINLFIFNLTDTKAVFYLCAIYIVVAYLVKFSKKDLEEHRIISKIVLIVPLLCTAICFLCCTLYNSSDVRWVALNSLLTGRLSLSHQALEEYGYSLFGQLITWNTGLTSSSSDSLPYFYVDSSFLNIAFVYGLVILVVLLVAFMWLIKKATSNNLKWLCLAIIFLMLHSMSDPQLIEVRYNLLLLYIAPLLCFVGARGYHNEYSTVELET